MRSTSMLLTLTLLACEQIKPEVTDTGLNSVDEPRDEEETDTEDQTKDTDSQDTETQDPNDVDQDGDG